MVFASEHTQERALGRVAASLQQHTALPDPAAVLPPHLKATLPAYAAFGQTGFGQEPENSISLRAEINE